MSDLSRVSVRAAIEGDCPALATCHLSCWAETYGDRLSQDLQAATAHEQLTDRWRLNITTPGNQVVVGALGPEIVAFARSAPSRDPDPVQPFELCSLYVRRAWQGTGLADELLRTVLGDEPASLWVWSENRRALAFYRRHGFLPDGVEKRHSSGMMEIRLQRA